jgi:hypothetical protein
MVFIEKNNISQIILLLGYEMLKILTIFNSTNPQQISLISCICGRNPNFT